MNAESERGDTMMEALSLYELGRLIRLALREGLPDAYWVQAELSEVREAYNGHCYIELVQKAERGNTLLAKARGNIWANVYKMLRPYFESATGQAFTAGIKVLLQVSVEYHEQYGLSLTVHDIDPTYTLGDMARRRREILQQLEEEGVLTVSCAGGARAELTLPLTYARADGAAYGVTVSGLQGGHSGVEIHKNRANANKVMGEFLSRVQKLMPLCITGLSGGSKDNAIPRSCQVTLVAMGMYIERINDVAAQLQQEIREQYDEPDVIIRGDDVDALGGNALTTECSAKLIGLLNAAPNGVQAWSQDIEGLVQTSLNLGVMKLDEEFTMTFAVRSSVNQEKIDLAPMKALQPKDKSIRYDNMRSAMAEEGVIAQLLREPALMDELKSLDDVTVDRILARYDEYRTTCCGGKN